MIHRGYIKAFWNNGPTLPGAILLLAVLAACRYPTVVLGWDTFVFRDYGLYGYPVAHYFRDCFWRGEVPLWNPLSNGGMPFLAHWANLILYPFSLFYLLFPLTWSLGIFCLVHLVLGGVGCYLLARRWFQCRFASAVASLAYAYGGFTINSLMWPHYVVVIGLTPWLVWACDLAWHRGGRWLLVAALLASMHMLGGVPELILFTWFFLAGLLLIQLGKPGSGRLCTRFLAVSGLTAGLTAIQTLTFLAFLSVSERNASFGGTDWAMPTLGFANFLVPLFQCYARAGGQFFQLAQAMTGSYYVGSITVVLAVLALWLGRNRLVVYLGLATVLSLVLALGENGYLYPWLREAIPQLGFMRFPIKFLAVALFLLPLLAAQALATMLAAPSAIAPRTRSLFNLVVVLGLIGIALIVLLARLYPLPEGNGPICLRNGLGRAGFLVLLALLIQVLTRTSRTGIRILLQIGFLLTLFADLQCHVPEQNPVVSASVYQEIPWPSTPKPAHGQARLMVSKEADQRLRRGLYAEIDQDYLWKRLGHFDNCNLIDGLPKLGGFYSIYIGAYYELMRSGYAQETYADLPLYDFLGAAFISAGDDPTRWERRARYLPLVTAGQTPVFASPEATKAAILKPGFTPRDQVYLPLEVQGRIPASARTTIDLESVEVHSHEIEIHYEAEDNGMVVVAQPHYPCWRAYVDGDPTPIWRANHAFQAVAVPAGKHELLLRYEDYHFRAGAVISLALLLALLGWGLTGCFRVRLPCAP